ncbi:OprD family outer membrane porin [Pseudomonas sp. WHRI 8519]|uniref:OprD family outer membrane porin n=1 Tax=Pseudomonas sp. WHRI 8519 TaxID=3162567 RepID=UPI00355742F3
MTFKARNDYFNCEQRDRGATQSYGEEWEQGFIGTFQSGFTTGTLGLDALSLSGLLQGTGDGRTAVVERVCWSSAAVALNRLIGRWRTWSNYGTPIRR